ncbi:Rhodanese-like domain-containing protein [Chytridium lagenaria]|nr:Rhodanese-like domain-containing protein [Chytridium lagenaria]
MSAPFVEPETVAAWLKDPSLKNGVDYQIVDVRDEDFNGGHILGAKNIPAHELLEDTAKYAPELAKPKKLIFHCALSQVRGPKSANGYLAHLRNSGAGLDQEVLVLKGGFTTFQYKYKDDKELVEDYNEKLWRD